MDESLKASAAESNAAAPPSSEAEPAAGSHQDGDASAMTAAAHSTEAEAKGDEPSQAGAALPAQKSSDIDIPKRSPLNSVVLHPERIFTSQADQAPPFSRMRSAKTPLWRKIDPFLGAGVAVALGVGWIIGANTLDNRSDVNRLRAEVSALSKKMAAVDAHAVGVPKTSEIKSLREGEARQAATIRAQNIRLEAANRTVQTRIAQMSVQLERLEKDPRLDQITARLGRLEHQVSSHLTTASIAPTPVRPAPAPPPVIPKKEETPAKTASVSRAPSRSPAGDDFDDEQRAERAGIPGSGYVLRDVYRGKALVESRAGLQEIAPGDLLPGAGRVERIVKRDGGWVVVTSNGIIDQTNY
jgi:hypothetical protein